MASAAESSEVLVVGGGPVGMLLAGELRLHGAEVTVLERLPEPSGRSRAFRLQPRTLELLDARGLLERFEADHLRWPKAHFAGVSPLLRLDRLDSAHPYSLLIPQARTERLLEEWATELGARILRGHELTGLTQDAERVTARVAGPDGEYAFTAGYLVGCDGGRSTVRKAAGIGFPGTGGGVTALLGDVRLEDPAALPVGVPGTMRTPRGLLMAVALEEGVTRVLTTEFGGAQEQEDGRSRDRDRDAPVTLEELRAGIRRVTGAEVPVGEATWLSRFSDATRLAENYRSGRVLLAGDAAHVHFPIGAQGLNLGLADAVNLGWKLAAESAGRAPEGLLDSYHAERHPVAVRVLRETRAQLALMNPDERVDALREVFSELLAIDEVNLLLSELTSGLDVVYDLADEAGPGSVHPRTGRRAPELSLRTAEGATVRLAELLRPGRPVLVDPTPAGKAAAAAAGWADRVAVVTGEPVDAEAAPALLVRPDGHVAWAADEGDEGLRAALARWFGETW